MLLVVTAAGCVVERGIVSSCALSMWFIWICCFIFFIDCSGEEANRAQKKEERSLLLVRNVVFFWLRLFDFLVQSRIARVKSQIGRQQSCKVVLELAFFALTFRYCIFKSWLSSIISIQSWNVAQSYSADSCVMTQS